MNLKHSFSLFIVLMGLFSCGKVENSNSTDKFIYGDSSFQGTPQFVAAANVLQTKCMFCHDHAHWKSFTENEFITTGLVIPQGHEDSPIYFRNINATGSGLHNMPIKGYPALTVAELELVITWINSL